MRPRFRRYGDCVSFLSVMLALAWLGSDGFAFTDEDVGELEFSTTLYDQVREGYLTLEWNSVEDAARYEVFDSANKLAYSGPASQAFLSGLNDGTYSYSVRAISDTGDILASSQTPAVVHVAHWPMQYVMVLFAVGLCVVISVAVVILRGMFARESVKAIT